MRVLVVGCGSIGERHLRVFKQLEVEAIPCEPRQERLRDICNRYNCEEAYQDINDVDLSSFHGAIICTATSNHADHAQKAIEAGVHVLIEKPISHISQMGERLIKLAAERDRIMAIGYVLRFHPGLEAVKALLDQDAIGTTLCARIKSGSNFAEARPDYRHTYFAQAETGGGIILDGSHEIDYLLWLMRDDVVEVSCMSVRPSLANMQDTSTTSSRISQSK